MQFSLKWLLIGTAAFGFALVALLRASEAWLGIAASALTILLGTAISMAILKRSPFWTAFAAFVLLNALWLRAFESVVPHPISAATIPTWEAIRSEVQETVWRDGHFQLNRFSVPDVAWFRPTFNCVSLIVLGLMGGAIVRFAGRERGRSKATDRH